MPHEITAQQVTPSAFAPFGEVIAKAGAHSYTINNGKCRRFHDLAQIDLIGPQARPLISILRASPMSCR